MKEDVSHFLLFPEIVAGVLRKSVRHNPVTGSTLFTFENGRFRPAHYPIHELRH
jgi:hypothetical protein